MADRPINMRDWETRAIQAGTKRQIRRILKPQPTIDQWGNLCAGGRCYGQRLNGAPDVDNPAFRERVVRIAPGDRLWCREAWSPSDPGPAYMADHPGDPRGLGWRPSIHMPRRASRLTLVVTEVRVQRLQDISGGDIDAEGFGGGYPHAAMPEIFTADCGHLSMRQCFARLWNSIHGPDAWTSNPWVSATSFNVHHRNIDAMEASHAA